MRKIESNGVVYFEFENLSATGLVRHGFSTRIGGVSKGHHASLNLALKPGDDFENILENFRRICIAMGSDMDNVVISHQVHKTNIRDVTQKDRGKGLKIERDYQEIDGLITSERNLILTTHYGDCVPLLLLDVEKRVIAGIHAGWRGTLANIAGKAVAKFINNYNSNPRDILVGIGPSISAKNFEVRADVYEKFQKTLPVSADFIYNGKDADKRNMNLWGINRCLLEMSGILSENIECAELCTFENPDLFYSHRRDGLARGTLAAFIELI
ncbi:MAG: peptidoglycan editing factor PgeF [Defluviitaleaceae bacterium]|nr:peptidoglycan editing factor PgeF [Defluviitaleaceae bacterium]